MESPAKYAKDLKTISTPHGENIQEIYGNEAGWISAK